MPDIFDEIELNNIKPPPLEASTLEKPVTATSTGDIFDEVSPDISREEALANVPFEIEFAQFGGEVGPPIFRTPEEERASNQAIANFARGTLETAIPTIGALVGSGLGPLGLVAGGGLGFAIAEQLSDIIDESLGLAAPDTVKEEILSTVENILIGSTAEAGGGALVTVGGGVKAAKTKLTQFIGNAFPSISKAGIEDKAIKVLKDVVIDSPEITRNIRNSKKIEEAFPGTKFTLGQLSDSTKALNLERNLTKTGTGREAKDAQLVNGAVAIRNKMDSAFANRNGVAEVLDELSVQRDEIETALTGSVKGAKILRDKFRPDVDIQIKGRNISGELGESSKALKTKVNDLYNKVPNIDIPTDDLHSDLVLGRAKFLENNVIDDFPVIINKRIDDIIPTQPAALKRDIATGRVLPRETLVPKTIKYQQLRSQRTAIGNQITIEKKSIAPNQPKIAALTEAFDSYSKAMDRVVDIDPGASQSHEVAKEKFIEFANKFRTGTVSKVLRPGRTPGSLKISSASIASEFFGATKGKLDAADDLINAIGPEKATETMRDVVSFELLNNKTIVDPLTNNINSKALNKWAQGHKALLTKYNLFDEVSDLASVQNLIDRNMTELDLFNKSMAGRFLNASPDIAVTRAFEGVKDTGAVARELLFLTKGNEAATQGIKSSYSDMLSRQVLDSTDGLVSEPAKTAKVIQKVLRENKGAIRAFYGKDKESIKALNEVKKFVDILARTDQIDAERIIDKTTLVELGVDASGPLLTSRLSRLNAFRKVAKFFNDLSKEQVDEVLTKAIFDPEYTELLLSPQRNLGLSDAEFDNFYLRLMGRLGILGITQAVSPRGPTVEAGPPELIRQRFMEGEQ